MGQEEELSESQRIQTLCMGAFPTQKTETESGGDSLTAPGHFHLQEPLWLRLFLVLTTSSSGPAAGPESAPCPRPCRG